MLELDDEWDARVVTLSVHPDCATRDDVARLAADLMAANARIVSLTDARNRLAQRVLAAGLPVLESA